MVRDIDVKKYLEKLVHCWWLAVMLVVICGVALGAFKYTKDKQEYKKEKEKLEQSLQAVSDDGAENEGQVKDKKVTLDVVERQNVELAVEYYRLIQQYTRYKDSSVYLSQNPYKVDKTTLYFTVSLDNSNYTSYDEEKIIIGNIVLAYVNYIITGEFATGVAEDINLEQRYVIELVSAGVQLDQAGLINGFVVTIVNDEQYDDLSKEVQASINNYSVELTKNFSNHSIKLIDEYNAEVIDSSLDSAIQGVQTDIYNASNRLATLKKGFSDEQLAYYNESIGVVNSKDVEEEGVVDTEAAKDETMAKLQPARVQVKYIVLGVILGIVAYCCIILIGFIFTSKVLAESGFESMFGIRYLGHIKESSSNDVFGMVIVKIMLACKKDNIDKIALIGSDFDNVSELTVNELVTRLENENIRVERLDNVLSNCKELTRLFDINKCILAEHTGKTRINDLEELVDICNDNGIAIYGVVDM